MGTAGDGPGAVPSAPSSIDWCRCRQQWLEACGLGFLEKEERKPFTEKQRESHRLGEWSRANLQRVVEARCWHPEAHPGSPGME